MHVPEQSDQKLEHNLIVYLQQQMQIMTCHIVNLYGNIMQAYVQLSIALMKYSDQLLQIIA